MALVAYNLTVLDLILAAGNPAVTLPASTSAGVKGPKFNVTAELKPAVAVDPDHGITGGLDLADYILLQAQVAAGDVVFEWTEEPEYLTGSLIIGQYTGAVLYVGPFEEYTTIQDAIDAAEGIGTADQPVTIRVKDGTYTEDLTLVSNIKVVGEFGGGVVVIGTHTATVAAGEDWGGSFYNMTFRSGAGASIFTVINTAGIIPSDREWIFRNCSMTSGFAGGSLTRNTDANLSIYDSTLERTVTGSDLVFVAGGGFTYIERCSLNQVDGAQYSMSTTDAGTVYGYISAITGCLRSAGTGGITLDACQLYAGTAAVSTVEAGVGTVVELNDCSIYSQSTRSRKTFVGDGAGGEVNLRGCRYGSNVFFSKNPLSPFVQSRDLHSMDLESNAKYNTRVISDVYTNLLVDGGTTPSTDAVYRMDVSAGAVMCDGAIYRTAGDVDTVILGAGTWGRSYNLSGGAPVALTDGNLCEVAIVAVNVSGTVNLHAVFGIEVTPPAVPEKPTAAQVSYALEEAGIYGSGTIIGYLNLVRAGVAVNETTTDPATDDALAVLRNSGFVYSAR